MSAFFVAGISLAIAVQGQNTTTVWDGGGTDNNWSTSANWVGDVAPLNPTTNFIAFAGTTRPSPVVNAPWTLYGLVISNGASAFTLTGSSLTLTAAGTAATPASFTHLGTNLFTITNNIILATQQSPTNRRTFTIGSTGSATFSGAISNSSDGLGDLHVRGAGAGVGTLNGPIWLGTNHFFHTDVATWVLGSTGNVWDLTQMDQSSTVRIAVSDALPTNTTISFNTTAPRIDLNNFNQTIRGLVHVGTNVGGVIRTGLGAGGTLTISDLGLTNVFRGQVVENGRLVKTGPGSLQLGGVNTITNGVRVQQGELRLLAISTLANNPSNTILVTNGAQLAFASVNAMAANHTTQLLSPIVVAGSTILCDGKENRLGNITLNGGTMLFNGGSAIWGAFYLPETVSVVGASASIITNTALLNGTLRPGLNTMFAVDDVTAGDDLTIYAPILGMPNNGGGGGFTKAGAGTLRLAGANTMSGSVTVAAGKLVANDLAMPPVTNITVAAGAGLDISAYPDGYILETGRTLQGAGYVQSKVTLRPGSRLLAGGEGVPGTLAFTGLVGAADAAFEWVFDLTNNPTEGAGINDLITIDGDLAPTSSGIRIRPLAPLSQNRYRLINYTGTLLSSFASVVLGNTYRDTWTLDTATNGSVDLVVTAGTNQSLTWSPQLSANWDLLASTNWTNTAAGALDFFADGDAVRFDDSGAASNVVNLLASLKPGSVTVDASSNYTFTGTGRLDNGFAPATIVKDGTGSLTLGIANGTSGGLVVSNGAVVLAVTNAAGAGPVTLSAGATLEDVAGGTIAVAIGGAGRLMKTAGGLLTLTGTNTYAGETIISNGLFTVAAPGRLGNGVYAASILDQGTLTFSGATQLLSGAISGTGSLVQSGALNAGALTLTGSNTFTGLTTVQAGSLTLANPTGAALVGPVVFDNNLSPDLFTTFDNQFGPGVVLTYTNNAGDHGRFELLGTTQTLAGIQTTYTNQRGVVQNREFGPTNFGTSVLILNGSSNYAYSGYLRNSTGVLGLWKNGTGTQNLNGVQITHTGLTVVSSGLLLLSNATAFASAISNDAVVEFNSSAPNDATPDWGYTKTLSGTGTVNKTGTGWLHIQVGQVAMSGQINVQGGIFSGNTGGSTWTGNTANLDISAGAVFSPHGNQIFLGALTGAGLVDNRGSATSTITFGGADRSGVFTGNITNNANALSLVKIGAGTQTLSGTNVHTGTTTINAGTLTLGAGAQLAATPRIVLATGTTFDVTAVGTFPLANLQSLEGFGTVSGQVSAATGSRLVPGTTTGAGTLTFNSQLNLAAATTNQFNLSATDTNIGSGVNDLIEVGGAFEPSNAVVAVSFSSPSISNGTYRLFNYAGAKSSSFNPAVAGNTSRKAFVLDEATPGQVNLTVSGSFLGLEWNAQTSTNWDVNAGTNWLDLAGVTNTTFFDGDSVLFDDSGAATNSINLVGTLKPGSIVVNSASNYTLSGTGRVSGTTGLLKDGSGTLTLGSAGHDFSGSVTVTGGTLRVAPASVLPSLVPISVAAGSTLNLDGANASYTNLNPLSGAGTVLATFTGATANNLYLQGNSTGFVGTVELTPNGVVGSKLNSAGLALAPTALIKVNSGAQLFFASSNNLPNPVQVVGTGNNEARGAIRLGSTNALTGAISLTGSATVGLEGGNVLGDITNGVAGTSTLTLGTANSGNVGLFGGTLADGAGPLAVVVANGTPTLAGTNTYTGGTTMSGGTLVVGAIADAGVSGLGNTGPLVFGGGTLRFTGLVGETARAITNTGASIYDVTGAASTLRLTGPIAGPGLITKLGVGALIWSNNTITANGGWRIRQGSLTLDGASYTNTTVNEEFLGNAAGDTSRLLLTNGSRIIKTAASWFQVGTIAGSTGVMTMADGVFSSSDGTKGFLLGNQANTFGVLNQLGGSMYVGYEFDTGYGTSSSYGFQNMLGGFLTVSNWHQAGRTGLGLIYLLGGTNTQVSSAQGLIAGNAGTGVIYAAGAQVNLAGRLALGWSGATRGELTISGVSTVQVASLGVQFNANTASTFNVFNLNGGLVKAQSIFKQGTGGYSIVNFDGGVYQPTVGQTVLGTGAGGVGAVDAAYVRPGGAFVEVSNLQVSITQPLRAPAGSGVSALPATGTLTGYLGAPYVAIRGGGGTGATAVALFDYASGSVTGLVLTSPGVDYTSAPTVTLQGGGPSNLVLGTATIDVNGSGGLTKRGSGSLALNAVNTYTGDTVVAAGVLFGTGSVAGAVTVAGGASIGPSAYTTVTGTFTVGTSLTLSNGAILSAYLRGTNPSIRVNGDLNVASTTIVQLIAFSAPTTGTQVLVDYAGAFNGSIGDLSLLGLPYGAQGYLTNNAVDTRIELVITNTGTGLKWSGLVDATWKHVGPANWKTVPGALPTAYSPLDPVLFDDTAAANFAINVTEPVAPASITVNNVTNEYSISGNAIASAGALVKSGAGAFTLANANTFAGGTVLNAGTLRLANTAAIGAAGQPVTLNGGLLSLANDTAVNAYNATLGGGTTVVVDRATGGAGLTNTLANLTATAGSYTFGVTAGTNVLSGVAGLVFNGTWSNNGQTTTFDVGPSAALTLSGAMSAGAQTVSVVKRGAGRLVLSGGYATWDFGNPIALNEGMLDLRVIPGDTGVFRDIVASNNTVLALTANANIALMSGLTLNGSMNVLADRITAGAGITNSLGVLTFTGTNTVLNAGAGAGVSAGTAAITFNTTTLASNSVVNVTNPTNGANTLVTITGLVSGVGRTLVKNGDGALTLRPPSPNNYSGGTIVNGGVLNLGFFNGGANQGTIAGPLTINTGAIVRALVEKALGFPTSASGNVTTVTINGGLLEHTGVNGMNGGQTVFMTAGEIRSNGGVPSTNSGCFRVGSGPDPTIYVLASASTSLISGRVALDATGRFDVQDGAADADLLISAAITDGIGTGNPPNGIVKSGAGRLVLTAANRYSGTTVVSNGTLLVQGSLNTGAVTVVSGATLGGTGTLGGSVTSAGTVAPGASAGHLIISGSYTQAPGATLAIEIGGVTAGVTHDWLDVTGSASIAGALSVSLINGYIPTTNDQFVVLSAGALAGGFATTNLPALSGSNGWKVDYLGNAVILSVTNGAPPATGYDLAATVITNGLSGYQDDADGDGYANLLEYVTGGSLTNAGNEAKMQGTRTNGLLALRFTRDTNAIDATIVVEGSTSAANSATWLGIATNIGGSWGAATNVVSAGTNSPLSETVYDTDSGTNRFLRLRVTRP